MTGMVVEAESFAPPLSAGVTVEEEDEDSDSLQICIIISYMIKVCLELYTPSVSNSPETLFPLPNFNG
ncbi:unnamed protein product [Musa acuminata subsp. burmannicoides]